MNNKLFIVVPCYNEEQVLPLNVPKLLDVLNSLVGKELISKESKIVLVNDGSRDKTQKIIKDLAYAHRQIIGLNLAGNVGHQNALIAGLEYAEDKCDMTISIDADLQDDISVIENMVKEYISGADIVFGVRDSRKCDTFFKRSTAQAFYRFMNLLGVNSVYNHADFRLMSSRAVSALLEHDERNLFLRGIVANMGFNTATVFYSRKERQAGESKYPLNKMFSFAWDGITSFSIKPINLVAYSGVIIVFCAVIAFFYTIISHILGHTIIGWSSLMISIWFLGGVQLFSIGLIGQYIGKTYIESKHRPRYHIESIVSFDNTDTHE